MKDGVIEWIREKKEEGIEEDVIKEALMKKEYTEEESDKLLIEAGESQGNSAFADDNHGDESFLNYLKELKINKYTYIGILLFSLLSVGLMFQLFHYQPNSCNISYSFNNVDYDGETISLNWDMSASGEHRMRTRSIFLEREGNQSIFASIEELREVDTVEKNFDNKLNVDFVPGNYELSSVTISLSDCDKSVNVNFDRLSGDFNGSLTENDYSIETLEY